MRKCLTILRTKGFYLMKYKFKLTISKIKYPFKADWDGDESLDNIPEESREETTFIFNNYDDTINKLFEEEFKKESDIHGELIQVYIDINPNNRKYNLDELVDYVLFKNNYDNYDFVMVGHIDVILN